jgi:hypothetical protein
VEETGGSIEHEFFCLFLCGFSLIFSLLDDNRRSAGGKRQGRSVIALARR